RQCGQRCAGAARGGDHGIADHPGAARRRHHPRPGRGMKPAAFDYAAPADVPAALALAAGAGGMAKYLAGGQSLGPLLNLRLARPGLLIDLRRIPALSAVTERPEAIRYGAATPHAAIEDGRVPDATG